jgi:hypothetical protein
MWNKGLVVLIGLAAALGFGWVSAQEPSSGWSSGASYILKAGDCVTWPSGHPWYMRMTSTSSYPFKVVTTSSSGRAVYAKAPAGGYALYAEGRLRVKGTAMVDSVRYNTPRSHKLTIGAESFVPAAAVPYSNSGVEGAHIDTSGAGEMVAPIHLPDGAVITQVKAYFYDNSTSYFGISVVSFTLAGEGYAPLLSYSTVGKPGYSSHVMTPSTGITINNASHYYCVGVLSPGWDTPNLRIKGVIITYTVSEAL